jgi:ABC transporter substrate binding protein
VNDRKRWLDQFVHLMGHTGNYSREEAIAAIDKERTLPDVLSFDPLKPAKYPNGRVFTDDVINPVRISSPEEFETAFASMDKDRPDAVIVQPSLPSKRAAELALKHRVPAVSVSRWFAEEGGLMAYSARYIDLFRKAAVYVDKIFKGAQPADLPVEQPTHFALVINMKTAKALGIDVPESLLTRADEVIE